MLKTISATGGLVAAAAAAGILLTGSPASAQAPTGYGHRRWAPHHGWVSTHRVVSRNRNRNVNVNLNRVVVGVRVINRNNNVAVARNFGNRPNRFFGGDGCCSNGFGGDGFIGRGGFIDGIDGFGGGATAVIGRRGTFARAGDAVAFVD